MKTILSFLFILVFTFWVFAQTAPEKKIIRWGSPNAPNNCCRNYIKENRLITTYEDESIYFQIGIDVETEKKFVAVLISIANKSDTAFTVYPENFQMRQSAPNNKTYNSIPIDEVAKKIENRGKWRMIAAQALAGMATRQSNVAVTDGYGNRADITITEKDRAAQRRVNEANNRRISENEERANTLRAIALPAHTVFRDKDVTGFVFFKKEDLANGMIISFIIGDTTYEIPYGTERNPNAGKK